MSKPLNIVLGFVTLCVFVYVIQFLPNTKQLSISNPYFVLVEDYEPQRNKKFYLYDINHPAMMQRDGSIKTRTEFLKELIAHNAKECHFIQNDVIDLVTPDQLFKYKENDKIYRNKDGSFLERPQIIRNFEELLTVKGKISPEDTLVINKDSTYYYTLRSIYYDKKKITDHRLVWGDLTNEGTIPLSVLKSNVVLPLEVYDDNGDEVEVYQATLGFYTWKQVCGKMSFDKNYAPLMRKGILSKEAVVNIQSLNQSGECVLVQNIIVIKDGKFVELSDRFKFVVKNTSIAV